MRWLNSRRVVVHHHPDHALKRLRHGDLARAQKRHAVEAELPRGDGRELGVEIVGDREEAAHHRRGRELVAPHDLLEQLAGASPDLLGRVLIDRDGAAKGEEAHAARFCQQSVAAARRPATSVASSSR